MPANIGYATPDAESPLAPREFDRPPVGPEDVRIEITHDGASVRVIDTESINDAFDDIADNDVAFRYVIDNSTLPAPGN